MKKLALLFAVAAFVGVTQAQPYAAWSRYRNITVSTASAAGPLTNYPVLVRFANTNISAGSNVLSDALANGADVRFTDSTGLTALSYEIDTWNSSAAAVWVRLPSVPANSSIKIRVYWGKAGSATASNAGAVFDSASNFVGVWHLGNAAGIAARPNAITGAPPATPANNGGTFGGTGYVAPVGVIGSADAVGGTGTRQGPDGGSDYLNIGNSPDATTGNFDGTNTFGGYTDFSNGFTYSAWVKALTPPGNYTYLVELANTNGANTNVQVFRPAVDTRYRYEHVTGTTTNATNQKTTPTGSLVEGTWEHLTVTVGTGATPSISWFMNGVRVQGPTNGATALSVGLRTNAWLGKSNYLGDYYFAGAYDDVRISKVARDSNWVLLDYATQVPGSTALTLGNTVSSKALFYPQNNPVYTINDSANNVPVISGALTGSYAISPAASNLPTGLGFSTTTGAFTGKLTAAKVATQFIVTATIGGVASSDTVTITVSAGNPPGAPTGVTGARASKTVTLTWLAPSIIGSSAITGYKAMAVSDTTKFCTTTTALTCAVTGLTNGTAYTFVVKATNTAGTGAASAATSAITPATIPGAPLSVVATAVGTNVTVTWAAPASDSGSAIIEYYCVTVPVGGSCYAAMPSPLTSAVGNLLAGTSYTVAVYAVNGIGTGPNSVPSAPVTPTGINPGSFVIRVSGSAKPFTFVLPDEALTSAEKVTMSISDIYGRTVWSKSVNPKIEKIKELTWNGKSSNGRSVSAGMYVVKISTLAGGKSSEFTQKAISIKPL